jgi:hypothetical protein
MYVTQTLGLSAVQWILTSAFPTEKSFIRRLEMMDCVSFWRHLRTNPRLLSARMLSPADRVLSLFYSRVGWTGRLSRREELMALVKF